MRTNRCKRNERRKITVSPIELEVYNEIKSGSNLFRAPGCGRLFFTNPNLKAFDGSMDWRWLSDEQETAVHLLQNKNLLVLETKSFY
ncbi:MAG TPA: hypothetical protein DCL77_01750 [Prolixibacteraceae bacterium]|jgi:hypothetical protein|nr:hypothetical protein [Prolixibacteraceae bacterium]